jgi:BirA family biotin operon repressor/biotin-[acetyl-CoA-carboxylase] ligase
MTALDVALLRGLRAANVHLPAGELAGQLCTSSAAIRERIDALREAGFEIDERPGLGLRLVSAPDRLIADDLQARLGTSTLIGEIIVLAETSSTNDRAIDFARRGGAHGTVILAESQTAGRGRFGRRWESTPHAGIWCSLLLRPSFSPGIWPRLTTWAALGVAGAMEESFGVSVGIKWPNDVLVRERKVAGILIETGEDEMQRRFAVVGIGINANQTSGDFPSKLGDYAGSIRQLLGRPIDRAALAVALFRALERCLPMVEHDYAALVAEASRRSTLLGRWVRVSVGGEQREGMAEELDGEGRLVLREWAGTRRTLDGGEVSIIPVSAP